MKQKDRLSASVDTDLIAAAEQAVSRGEAPTVSAWVSEAIRLKIEHDRRLKELEAFLHDYEEEHGVITELEMRDAVRRARARAVIVRGSKPGSRATRRLNR